MSAPTPPRAIELLARLLRSQAYRELGAARLFEDGARFAPDEAAARELAGHAAEERAHLEAVLAVWAGLTGRPPEALRAESAARLAERPLPAPTGWIDLAMARFLYDRAGFWQLREYEACAYAPYRALVREIIAEEHEHQEAGAAAVVALSVSAAGPAEAQAAFTRWLRPALLSFGRPGSPASAEAIAFGLKRRDPAAVLADFVADVGPTVRAAGLRFPTGEALGLTLPAGWA
jgi:1,2-phenylacetyl-CoA epoxidase catalytic subunit